MLVSGLQKISWITTKVFLIMTFVFFVVRFVPGGPFDETRQLPAEALSRVQEQYRLNAPLLSQYLDYVRKIVMDLDFGPSFHYRAYSVTDLIAMKFPVSLQIGLCSTALALLTGLFIGASSAAMHGSIVDRGVLLFTSIVVSIPLFLLAPVLILLLARQWHLVPVAGWGTPGHLVIPVVALAFPMCAHIARLMRASMLEIQALDFVTVARAKGLSETTIALRHVLRGALIPVVSYLGSAVAGIICGSVVIEIICGIPGMGRELVHACFNRDYPVICGFVTVYAVILVVLNETVEWVYGVLDARVRA